MRKILAVMMTLTMLAALTACSGNAEEQNSSAASESSETAEETAGETEAEEETSGETEVENESTEAVGSNVLVAYFSATGTTEGVAETMAGVLGADLYEITPEEPYTDEDLDYNDDNSRSTIEMNDESARPAISGTVENMEQYDVIFLGYPIWWYDAPRIMSTFVESYDFNGKTVVPFCTSGGSGIGSSASNLEALTSGAQWLEGERFSGNVTQDEIAEWINGLGLNLTTE